MAPNKKTSTKAAKDAGKKDSLSPNDQRLLNIAWACLLEKQVSVSLLYFHQHIVFLPWLPLFWSESL